MAKETNWIAVYDKHDDAVLIVGGDARPVKGKFPGMYMSLNRIEISDTAEPDGEEMAFAKKVATAMNAAGIEPVTMKSQRFTRGHTIKLGQP